MACVRISVWMQPHSAGNVIKNGAAAFSGQTRGAREEIQ